LAAQVVLSDIIEQAKYNESIQSREAPPYVSKKHDPSMKFQGINEGHMISEYNNKPRDFLPLVEGILL
jgi:hypothetical protein